ncbi:tRNA (guanosine(37)-N1)-methyltransferase TrmD [Patescibacteria group bacterium]
MHFDIITIFPSLFNSFLNESLIKKSAEKKLNKFCVHDLRRWSGNKHNKVDDTPYGGGAGMIMRAEPIIKAVEKLKTKKTKIILLSPDGKQWNQNLAKKYAKLDKLILICGRYQGVDARVEKIINEKISIGPYVMSGGEIPAMTIVESIARLVPGYLGNKESLQDETFSDKDLKKKTYAQYTRPEVLKIKNKNYSVPKVLLSGNHQKIKEWRKKKLSY